MKLAMLRVDDALERTGTEARLLLQVHDELLLEVPAERDRRGRGRCVRDAMEGVHPLAVPLVVDQKVGRAGARSPEARDREGGCPEDRVVDRPVVRIGAAP